MEHTPSNIDAAPEVSGSADDKENKKKSKKSPKAERLVGAFAIKPEAEDSPKGAAKSENWWSGKPRPDSVVAENAEKGRENASESPESERELTALSPDEKRFIERELVRAEAEQESESGITETEQQIMEFRRRIGDGEDSEMVYSEILGELQMEEPVIDSGEADAEAPEFTEFADEGEIPLTSDGPAEIPASPNPETVEEKPEAEESTAEATQPPVPPRPPRRPRDGGDRPEDPGDSHRSGHWQQPPPGTEAYAAVPAAAQTEYYYQDNTIGVALLGGLVGYLIGRRRGRIKTERRLLPIQKKLRNEVKQLQTELQTKEMHIREAAKQQSRRKEVRVQMVRQGRIVEASPASASVRTAERPVSVRSVIESAIPKPEITENFSERIFQRTIAPEASAIHGAHHAREHIGHVIVTAEARTEITRSPAGHAREGARSVKEAPVIPKHVEEMNRNELLAIGEKVVVEGSSLRKIYENRLIGERGLKRLVAEHLRGGDLKRALKREIFEREIDFERDPVMRDHAPTGGAGSDSTHVPLETLLQKAAASIPSNPEEAAYYTARAKYEAKQQAGKRRQQRILDNSLTGIIVLLLVLIIILILRRS